MRRLGVALAAALIAMPALLAAGSPEAFAAGSQIWVEVGSETPGPGCYVATSVEVHEGGPVAGAEIALAFHVDSDVYSVNRGFTDDNGIAFLGFDLGDAPAGRAGSLDVNVNGAYIGSVPLAITDGGGCDDNPEVFELGGGDVSGGGGGTANLEPVNSVWVPALWQQRGLSCEYASLAIAMAAYGTQVTEWDFDPYFGQSSNPHVGFRGNIYGEWGGTDDYGIYAEPLAAVMPEFGYWADVFYANGDTSQLTRYIDNGTPVLVWMGLKGDTGYYETGADGSSYWIAAGQHTLVIYGYDADGVYASDPAIGAKRFYGWGDFIWMWNVFDGMSLAIGPN